MQTHPPSWNLEHLRYLNTKSKMDVSSRSAYCGKACCTARAASASKSAQLSQLLGKLSLGRCWQAKYASQIRHVSLCVLFQDRASIGQHCSALTKHKMLCHKCLAWLTWQAWVGFESCMTLLASCCMHYEHMHPRHQCSGTGRLWS